VMYKRVQEKKWVHLEIKNYLFAGEEKGKIGGMGKRIRQKGGWGLII